MNNSSRLFRRLGILTIAAVYLLILVGGIVRSSGSGMGCPDWPKCFGNWVPPTDASQLPEDYKEIYSEKRKNKNLKLAGIIEKAGFSEVADKIANDQSIYEELDFNPVKTWIEYGNRIVGVIIGLLVFLVFVFSFPFIKTDKVVFILSLISFLLVGFEGWLGSIVVSTNLLPFTVTLHMVLALVIVCMLIYVVLRSQQHSLPVLEIRKEKQISYVLVFFILITLIQIVLGTQVREEVDRVSSGLDFQQREVWLEKVGGEFLIHRSFSIIIMIVAGTLVYLLGINSKKNQFLYRCGWIIAGLLIIEIFTGVILNYLGFPALVQPVHLLLGTLVVGVQFLLLLLLKFNSSRQPEVA